MLIYVVYPLKAILIQARRISATGAGGSGQWWGLLHATRTERAPVSAPAEFLQLKSFFETWLCVNADT